MDEDFLDIKELLPSMDVIYIEVNNTYLVLYLNSISNKSKIPRHPYHDRVWAKPTL